MRRGALWLLFGTALAAVLGVMVWITAVLLDFERAQADSQNEAAVEEQVRLALWRLDSSMGPRLAREIAEVGYAASQAEAAMELPPGILGRFVLDGDDMADMTDMRWLGGDNAPARTAQRAPNAASIDAAGVAALLENPLDIETTPTDSNIGAKQADEQGYFSQAQQSYRSELEWQKRTSTLNDNLLNQQLANSLPRKGIPAEAGSVVEPPSARLSEISREGPLRPLWVGDELIVARLVRSADGKPSIQGSWLEWEHLRAELRTEVQDLLPAADLEPVLALRGADAARRLATLPVRIVPGELIAADIGEWSPLEVSLLVAWAVVLVASGAVFGLLLWSWSLSERRAEFVSAVTHELRTPLTTFRMYTEMLSEGMVEHKREQYVATLRKEAERLGHLVENVLAFARIERSRVRPVASLIAVTELLGRVEQRLDRRCEEADMRLRVELGPGIDDANVRIDPAAAEQILFNLVDNAAKYAPSATNPTIVISARREDRMVLLAVRDYGPGVSPAEQRRIFEPFAKGKAHQAGTKPGVGLGLALCRRLAGDLGGRLTVGDASPGCVFTLRLPAAS